MKGAVHVVGRRGPKWISLNRSLWWWWRGTHGIIGSGHMGTPSLWADRQTDRTENVSFPQTTSAGNNKTKHIETSTIVLKESGNMLKIVAAEFTKTHRIHFSRMLLSWNYYQLIIIHLEFKEETWRMHFVSDVVSVYVSLRLRVQNRRKKWNFPPNFRNGTIWTAPFPLNIRNGIISGGAFSKEFRSSEALISVLSKNARLCFRSSEALISVLSKNARLCFRSSEALISVFSKNAHLCFRSSEALISVLSKNARLCFRSSEALISVLSKNACLYDNI